ncbi:MAG: hypothetical protein FWG98_03450 [Candidatus Cloacimonetes bacterium]|nr:hypothetical protein [Candidatus Cloacimonadota bacterium]
MTAQSPDIFLLNRVKHELSAIENINSFLDIYSLGFEPEAVTTACWRGYIATYSIYRNRLVLKKLETNNGNKKDFIPPLLNSKEPIVICPYGDNEEYNSWKDYIYNNVNLFINYTGSILITKDFIWKFYVHMGFQNPISYNIVKELTFEEGYLLATNDLSDIASLLRKDKIINAKNEMKERNLLKWIYECFDISYENKAELFKKYDKLR